MRAVEMHLGMDFGGNDVATACGSGHHKSFSRTTRHHQVVLLVDEGGTVDWESRIVTLTG
ncbi:hypothetical protein [Streptacidiphilus monticola]|uniref:Uncharacterized protein n=1 Tax=Streptacidiphilus monticola TaxID=2161674 RepID=A0ABW1GC60_9ACTN